ncbi:MAG TPA: bacterial transcriptional activator domain-containing protein [Roseiflexaceae bacterium]|nr:bacterial transcriptional activator domain-containing protein [Roseiflexaceae bacterium]
MLTLGIHLFGRFSVECDAQTVPGFKSEKVQQLFCYLLLHRGLPHQREKLAALLWGDTSTSQSKTYLRKAVWQLQTTLNLLQPTQSKGLLIEHDRIQIHPHANLWVDVDIFEQAFNDTIGIPGEQIEDAVAENLRRAVELYRGDLLDGWYYEWCLYERERLQSAYLALLDKLMGYCEAHHDYERGLAIGTQILRYDQAREQTHQRIMRLYALSGDRTAALHQFERCAAILHKELGVRPTAYTRALYEQIRINHYDSWNWSLDGFPTLGTSAILLTDALDYLRQLQDTLTNLQQRIQHESQVVERMLKHQR